MDMSGPKKDAVYKGPILSSGGTGTPRGGSPLTVAGTSNSRTSSPAPTYTDEIKPNALEEKYEDLLSIVGDMSREVKPAYTGNKASVERLKKSILMGRGIVKELLNEVEKYNRVQLASEEQTFMEGV
jgi:hypothetical protein